MHPLKNIENLINAGRLAEAEQACLALPSSTEFEQPVSQALIYIYQHSGRQAKAVEILERLFATQPQNRALCDQLANSLAKEQAFTRAADCYTQYLACVPDDADAQFNCAYQHKQAGHYELAISFYEQALLNKITQPEEVMVNIAIIYSDCLRQETSAESYLKRALKTNATYIPALYNFGNLLEQQGNKEVAFDYFQRILTIQPTYYPALARLADVHKFTDANDTHILSMEKALTDNNLDQDTKTDLLFALGKALNDCKKYDSAFHYYQRANELDKKVQPKYIPQHFAQFVDKIIQWFDKSWFEAKTCDSSYRPIFICGMFRSGSTLCEQILAAHPDIVAGGELDFFVRQVSTELAPFPEKMQNLPEGTLSNIAEAYSSFVKDRFPNASNVTDKRPDNVLYVGLIKTLFPNAKIIYTRRQPLDNGLSVYFQRLGSRMNYANDLSHIGHYYLQQERLMAHWQSKFPESVYTFDYDQLIDGPEMTIRDLLSFLEFEWSANCLQFHTLDNVVKTASVWQVRQPLYSSSSGRWKHYQGNISVLQNALR